MGITCSKIIADIRNIATSGKPTDDFRITDRQILYWVNQARSMLIAQTIAKRGDYADEWIQTIGCLELEQVDISDCCSIPVGCYGLRSVLELPATVDTDKINEILSVTGLDGYPIGKTTQFSSIYKKYSKYTGKNKGWYTKNNRLYIINDDLLANVTVRGIFEDPSELENFVTCSGETCWTVDSDYPCSLKMAGEITNYIIKTKVQALFSFPQDLHADSSNETPEIK